MRDDPILPQSTINGYQNDKRVGLRDFSSKSMVKMQHNLLARIYGNSACDKCHQYRMTFVMELRYYLLYTVDP